MNVAITEERVRRVHDEASLFQILSQELHWPTTSEPDTYPFHADELGLTDEEASQIEVVRQIAPFQADQPWGIFLVKFRGEKVYEGALRRVLRGLSESRRDRDASLPAWKASNLLFICTPNFRDFSFAHFNGQTHTRATLSVFGWDAEGSGLRTLCEYNLPALRYPSVETSSEEWLRQWATAWNVERVTERFYQEYDAVFKQVEALITGVAGDKRLFTQRLFNRLMFIQFLSKKRWLRFGDDKGGPDYLRALWAGRDQTVSFYTAHLCPLFFAALNNPHIHRDLGTDSVLRSRIGHVPYLNGGLFQKSEDEGCGEAIPDAAFDLIINRLFSRFNFTVHESTPLDIEVAVDPEMLGKVFEELVTGRHESGSYYTPRPVVAFMCKEALKGYLAPPSSPAPPLLGAGGASSGALSDLIDRHDAGGVSVPQARDLLRRLADVKVVDPACGSGAYLLGMLQELFALNRVLDTRAEQASARDDYRRKLDIIRSNIYGVDLDDFAVQIARLRLWLSLAVEYDGEVPEPLPNLDFKVEQGDSLSAPDPQGGPTADIFRQKDIEEYSVKKAQYADPYFRGDKAALKREIKTLRDGIAAWAHPNETVQGFDWRVEFAEVFEPQEPIADLGGAMNFGGTLAEPPRAGGFDIALQNPPYVRQEDIKGKPHLQKLYTEGVDGKSDLYCYFYVRALQLLRPQGIQIFIVSNSWLDVGYGGKLQKYLLENAHVQTIYDSAVERQFATADINTIISVVRKGKPEGTAITHFVSLRAPFEQAMADAEKRRELVRTRAELWEAGLGEADRRGVRPYTGDKWGGKYLRAPDVFWKILKRGKDKLTRLGHIARVQRGFTTGANDFFYVRVLGVEGGIVHIRCDDGSEHTIEAEYVAEPALVKAREIVRPRVVPSDLAYKLVQLDEDAAKSPHAREYIRWGEASRKNDKGEELGQFHKRSTLVGRKPWYAIRLQDYAAVAFPMAHKRRAVIAALYGSDIHIDNRLYGVYPIDETHGSLIAASLFSTFSTLCREIYGRANFGQGMLDMKVYEAEDMPALDPAAIASSELLVKTFEGLADRPIQMLYDEVRRDDRKVLDDVFLSLLGFTDSVERADVLAELHDAACRRVWERQAKAERTRESRQTYDDWLASGLPFGAVDED